MSRPYTVIRVAACLVGVLGACATPATPTTTPTSTTAPVTATVTPPVATLVPITLQTTLTDTPPLPTATSPTTEPPTATPLPAATVSPPPVGLATPVSQEPAAGICADPPTDEVVVLTLNTDVPDPRCQKVTAEHRLRVVNGTGEALSFMLGPYVGQLQPGQDIVLDAPVGTYLAPGVHVLTTSTYAGSGPEIWLQP